MAIELSKATFRRCVQLYLAGCLLTIPLCVWQVVDPRMTAFDFEFRELLRRHYGWNDYSGVVLGAAAAFSLMHLAAAVGLLWYKVWARSLFWASMLAVTALTTAFGPRVEWYDTSTAILEILFLGLLGIIVLLSYASGLGANWFYKSAEAQKG